MTADGHNHLGSALGWYHWEITDFVEVPPEAAEVTVLPGFAEKGYHVEELVDSAYYLSHGGHDCMFIRTGSGVIVAMLPLELSIVDDNNDMTTTPKRALIPTFAALRFATGIAAWTAPRQTARLFGLASAGQQPVITQLFGSRELTLALAITDNTAPRLRIRALQLGLLTDTLDVIAAVRGLQRQTLPPAGAVVTGGGAALFLGLGVAALAHEKRARVSAG